LDDGRLGYMHWEEHWRKNGQPTDLHFGDGLAAWAWRKEHLSCIDRGTGWMDCVCVCVYPFFSDDTLSTHEFSFPPLFPSSQTLLHLFLSV
jgi:hypothetical protein